MKPAPLTLPLANLASGRAAVCAAFVALAATHAPLATAAPRGGRVDVDLDAETPDANEGALAEAARNTFAEGLRWYQKKKYKQALAAFLQTYALTKSPAVLVNLGQTNLRLGNPVAAIRYFEKFLVESKDIPADRRARVEASLVEARKQTGRIEVSAPEGAEISVDGEVAGRAPLAAPLDVLPGRHEVSMSNAAGTKTETVEVAKGAKVEIKLVPPRTAARAAAPPPKETPGAPPEEPGLFAPPRFAAPSYVTGAIGLVAFSTAFVLAGVRANAERNASTATEALARGGKAGACGDGAALGDPAVAGACNTLETSQRTLADTKQPFTIALWTGVGGAALSLGWYFLSPKAGSTTVGAKPAPLVVAPLLAPRAGGLVVHGSM